MTRFEIVEAIKQLPEYEQDLLLSWLAYRRQLKRNVDQAIESALEFTRPPTTKRKLQTLNDIVKDLGL